MKTMKMFCITLCMAFALFAASCTSVTEHGECIGLADADDQDPNLNYRFNTKNIVLAVIFFETIIVPIVVVFDEYKCPVSVKQ